MVPDRTDAMPKVELHVHIEGAIRPETVLRLAAKNGVGLPAADAEGLREFYRFRDFPHFVEVYVAVTRCIRDAEDIHTVVTEFLEGQAEQNILYTEATYTASTVESYCGIPWADQLAAIRQARADCEARLGTQLRLVLDIVRGDTAENAFRILDWVSEDGGETVCALGIAGEERRGTKPYQEVFDEARRRGVPVTAHAGETCGPESVAETLDVCTPRRIGHGVRAVEDVEVLARIRDLGVTLEVCPTSNVCLGVSSSWREHPLPQLVESGVGVCIGSDDPPMFGTTLTGELRRCQTELGMDFATVERLQSAAARAAFLAEDRKDALVRELSGPQRNKPGLAGLR